MLTLATRSYFSNVLLIGAARFARVSGQQEASYDGEFADPLVSEHRANVLAAITFAAAALEANINELLSDAAEPDGGRLKELRADERELLASLWELGIPRTARYRILEKYEVALTLLRRPPLDFGQGSAQAARLVVDLRNQFVHFEPTWQRHVPVPQKDAHKLERALNGRFAENRITGAGNPFYPDKLLGYGCAAWAVRVTTSFLDDFFRVLGCTPPYDSQRSMLAVDVPSPHNKELEQTAAAPPQLNS